MKNLEQEVSDIIDNIFDKKPIYPEDSAEYFIQQVLDKLVLRTLDIYPDKIYYCIGDNVYFEMLANPLSGKDCYFGVRYGKFWEFLHHKYDMNYNDIIVLIENVMEHHFKKNMGYPNTLLCTVYIDDVERHFKQHNITDISGSLNK